MTKINIAIDGFSSTGKSTLAKALAKELQYTYIDSGAMYRAITLYFMQNQIPLKNEIAIKSTLNELQLSFDVQNNICLNNINVEKEIRTIAIANAVSEVAAIPMVRDFCVLIQQAMGSKKGIVMDGRDIGTVVFPDAEIKIFLIAEDEIRIKRRFEEMQAKGDFVTLEEVASNLKHRDKIDSEREYNPLKKAADARIIDNSFLSIEEQVNIVQGWIASLNLK